MKELAVIHGLEMPEQFSNEGRINQLPSKQEFAEMLEADEIADDRIQGMGYSVYHKYDRAC